ncbi:MAG: hypothetical protein ACI9FB_002397 [Candidatus Azotimanducaceae bacterium]|jgi:hypothetical protein
MIEMLIIIIISVYGLYWLEAMRCKEIAVSHAVRECKRCEVQLLDQTVRQIRISMSRDGNDKWCVWREYEFEYTEDGDKRHRGRETLLGRRLLRMALETFNPIIH